MPHSINLSTVLIVFLVAVVLSTLLLRDLGKIGWKRLDMAALVLGFFGLFPATFDSQQWFKSTERDTWKEAADKNSVFTIQTFDMWQRENCRAANANQNLEVQKNICRWLTDQRANFRGNAEQLLPIAIEPLRNFPHEAEPLASELIKVAAWYNTSTNKWLALKKTPELLTFLEGMNNLVKSLSAMFGPYSLAIALAIKLTQIRAEMAEEQKKAKEANAAKMA
jgi:hypothetical protein